MKGRGENHGGREKGQAGTIKIKWVVSFIGCTDDMRATIRGPGPAQHASGGRAPGHAGDPRHDSQSASSRESGGVSDGEKLRERTEASERAQVFDEHGDYSPLDAGTGQGLAQEKSRVGRGIGSKLGKTAGAGNKGQKSRRGYSRRRGFEGGQMPLHRRIPKRGFHNPFGVNFSVVNLEELNVFPAGETVTPELLRAHGFIRRATDPIKVLGDGELKTKLAVHAHAFSATAEGKDHQGRRQVRSCSVDGD